MNWFLLKQLRSTKPNNQGKVALVKIQLQEDFSMKEIGILPSVLPYRYMKQIMR